MSDIIFKPWIGDNYKNGGIFDKKILALGESHYFLEGNPPVKPTDFTSDIVNYYLYPNGEYPLWFNTYKKFERALVNRETTKEDSIEIWNSIAFYNYLQTGLTNPRQKVPAKLYEEAEKPFFKVLEKLRPDLVIVWGVTRMWSNMPSNNYEPCKQYNGYYVLKDGTKIKTLWINHPSSNFDWSYWHNVIEEGYLEN